MPPPPASEAAATLGGAGAGAGEGSSTLLERVQDFMSENKRAILIGTAAAVLAVGGVLAYHQYQNQYGRSPRKRPGRGSVEKGEAEAEAEAGQAQGESEGKKKKKKKKAGKERDGPILEERTQPAKGVATSKHFFSFSFLRRGVC
jgi:import receptor subunit TOM70